MTNLFNWSDWIDLQAAEKRKTIARHYAYTIDWGVFGFVWLLSDIVRSYCVRSPHINALMATRHMSVWHVCIEPHLQQNVIAKHTPIKRKFILICRRVFAPAGIEQPHYTTRQLNHAYENIPETNIVYNTKPKWTATKSLRISVQCSCDIRNTICSGKK